jgi:hypothetical protein
VTSGNWSRSYAYSARFACIRSLRLGALHGKNIVALLLVLRTCRSRSRTLSLPRHRLLFQFPDECKAVHMLGKHRELVTVVCVLCSLCLHPFATPQPRLTVSVAWRAPRHRSGFQFPDERAAVHVLGHPIAKKSRKSLRDFFAIG